MEDQECLANKLNLTNPERINERKFRFLDVLVIIEAAAFTCNKDFKLPKEFIQYYKNIIEKNETDCLKNELYKIDKNLEILEGFKSSNINETPCDKIVKNLRLDPVEKYKKMLDSTEFPECINISEDQLKKLFYQAFLLHHEPLAEQDVHEKFEKLLTNPTILKERAECILRLVNN